MGNTSVGTVQVSLEARDDRLRAVFERSEKLFDKFGKSVEHMAERFNPLEHVIELLTVAALGEFIKKGFESVEAMSKQSDALGITTESYAGLKLAALGVSLTMDDVVTSFRKVNKTVLEAKEGATAAVDTLARLGLEAKDLAGLPADKQLGIIGDRLATIRDRGDRAAISVSIFGKEVGQKMVGMLAGGSAGLDDATKDADSLGLALSNVDAKEVRIAVEDLKVVWEVIGGIANRLAVEVAPYVAALAESFLGLTRETGGFRDVIGGAVEIAARGAVLVYDGWLRLQEVWGVLKVGVMGLLKVWMNWVTFIAGAVDHLMQTYKAGFEAIGAFWLLEWKTAKLIFVEFMDWSLVKLGNYMEKVGGLLNSVKDGLGDGVIEAATKVKDATSEMAKNAEKEWVDAKNGAVQAVKDLGSAYLQNFSVDLDKTSERMGSFWADSRKNLDDNLGIEVSKLQAQGDQRLTLIADFERKMLEIKRKARERAEEELKKPGPSGNDASSDEIAAMTLKNREKLLASADQDPRVKYEHEVLTRIKADQDLAQARQEVDDKRKVDAYLADPDLDSRVAYEVAVQQKINEVQEAQAKAEKKRQEHQAEVTISAYGTIASNLEQISAATAQQSLVAFRIHQGTAIASAMINAYLAYTQALAAQDVPEYLKYGMAATDLALGINAANQIASQRPPGRESGGPVSSGGLYQVGEHGKPELLSVGGKNYLLMGDRSGNVTPSGPGGGSVAPKVEVHVHAPNGHSARTQEGKGSDGMPRIDVIVEAVENKIAGGIRQGNGSVARSMETTYGVNRSRGAVR